VALLRLCLTIGALSIAPAGVAAASPTRSVAGAASPRFVFSFTSGLERAPIGAATAAYRDLFRAAIRLPNFGSNSKCFGLAYAVSAKAKRSRTPDLLLFCGDQSKISEAHFRSSAFCSTHGTCVATAGSMRKFVHELGERASVQLHSECGSSICSIVAASYGRIGVALRSANCSDFRRLSEISTGCIASEVLIYHLP
jgi:hypothetical protein